MADLEIKETQHCKVEDCFDFSHTAQWCGKEQPRRCGCAFCYPDWEPKPKKEELLVYVIVDGDGSIASIYRDEAEAEKEVYRLNHLTDEARRRKSYGYSEWFYVRTFGVE